MNLVFSSQLCAVKAAQRGRLVTSLLSLFSSCDACKGVFLVSVGHVISGIYYYFRIVTTQTAIFLNALLIFRLLSNL